MDRAVLASIIDARIRIGHNQQTTTGRRVGERRNTR
jgi:hypothetical protein